MEMKLYIVHAFHKMLQFFNGFSSQIGRILICPISMQVPNHNPLVDTHHRHHLRLLYNSFAINTYNLGKHRANNMDFNAFLTDFR